ncbi:uracil-DNA glycosylase [soil metagenome]|jgi:DNA polymerase|nr:uracil-DNA glycosylase [Deinococcota bacterium]
MDLPALEREASTCTRCPLHETRTHIVFGEGDEDAQLMIVGEGPGEEEDLTGRPFVGRSGRLLDKVLESGGIARNDVYIANMVKSRPPGNRNPKPEEIAACEPWLIGQIQLIRPQIIVTLGNVPTQHFVKTKDGITKTRGKWFEWHGIRVFPMFHPSYLLRNSSRDKGSPKWLMWQDVKELKAALDALGEKPARVLIDNAVQEGLF